jgi:hypothetical protein
MSGGIISSMKVPLLVVTPSLPLYPHNPTPPPGIYSSTTNRAALLVSVNHGALFFAPLIVLDTSMTTPANCKCICVTTSETTRPTITERVHTLQ